MTFVGDVLASQYELVPAEVHFHPARRQRVGGFMLGEHGSAQVPISSSVSIHGLGPEETRDTISQLRRGTETPDFDVLCAQARAHLEALVAAGQVAEAFAWIDTLPPDARVVLKPFITHFSGAKTADHNSVHRQSYRNFLRATQRLLGFRFRPTAEVTGVGKRPFRFDSGAASIEGSATPGGFRYQSPSSIQNRWD